MIILNHQTTEIKYRPSKKILQSDIYKSAKNICSILNKHHFKAYIVGGSVRDFILFPSSVPKDIDIATNANVSEIKTLFTHSSLVGNNFGVCIVKVDNFNFEVATFRKDGDYLDRRHPSTISAGTLFEDSQRRDFTMNSLYFSPTKEIIFDFHSGLKDIKNKIIKCVGNADKRIYEDALRILRCLRFSANFSFDIHPSLIKAIKKNKDGLTHIPMERVFNEISKVLNFNDFTNKFYLYLDISLFFKTLKKKTKTQIENSLSIRKFLNHFKFSINSSFFDFFICVVQYFKITNYDKFKAEIKYLPCKIYDKKLCLWFLNLMQIDSYKYCVQSLQNTNQKSLLDANFFEKYKFEFDFFKVLTQIENLEKNPNSKIFILIKKLIQNKNFTKLTTNYTKNKNKFLKSEIIQKLQKTETPNDQYSKILLKEYFLFINF